MAEAVTVENINVAEVMDREGVQEATEKILDSMGKNPVIAKLLEAAETVEDAYEVTKNYLKIKLEDFKVLFNKTVDYFKEAKTELSDEVMNSVVGGSFGSWWNKWKKAVIATAIVVGVVALGVASGGVALGLIGATASTVLGTVGSVSLSAGVCAGVTEVLLNNH